MYNSLKGTVGVGVISRIFGKLFQKRGKAKKKRGKIEEKRRLETFLKV